jgi:hypothetical protein
MWFSPVRFSLSARNENFPESRPAARILRLCFIAARSGGATIQRPISGSLKRFMHVVGRPSSRAYTVATLGLESDERRAVHSALALSEHGTPTFCSFVPTPTRHPHIVIVNGDSPEAVRMWRRRERSIRRQNICAIFLSRLPDLRRERYVLGRPLLPLLLLALLEHVAIKHHGSVPRGRR